MATGGTQSVDGADAPAAAAAAEPKTRGRFKIIEEEGPSRGSVSKVNSMLDLKAAGRIAGSSGRCLPGGGGAGLLPELLRLHEQAAAHAGALARLIDGVRASASGGNLLAAEEAALGGAAGPAAASAGSSSADRPPAGAAAGALGMPPPPRKPGGVLSRGSSSSILGGGREQRQLLLQTLLAESCGDALDVADKLLERSQVRMGVGLPLLLCRLCVIPESLALADAHTPRAPTRRTRLRLPHTAAAGAGAARFTP
jgi:hypothetical protein